MPNITEKYYRMKIAEADESEAGPSGLQQASPETNIYVPLSSEDVIVNEVASLEVAPAAAVEELKVGAESARALQGKFIAVVEAENYFLKQEVDTLKNDLENLSLNFSFRHIQNKDHLVSVYTGLLTCDIFLALYSLFENKKLNYFAGWQIVRKPKIDQLLLTLMKLKLNLLNDDLAVRFGISRETVSNIFKTWLFAIHEVLFQQLMEDVPTRNKNKLCMPSSVSSFTNCKIIIDCTEMSTIHPKNMESQRTTYSSYKHKNTLKGLVGVAPNGVVTFASKLYPGSTSDKKITHTVVLQQN